VGGSSRNCEQRTVDKKTPRLFPDGEINLLLTKAISLA
jgi:hypothetical protein